MNNISPFHLAIPVDDLSLCREFYGNILNCEEGRSAAHWVDFNFFGHQLVIHQGPETEKTPKKVYNPVDGQSVPVPHFGVVLEWDTWHELKRLLSEKEIQFIIEPYIRFKGEPGEQATMFFLDPAGNALEFKSFKNMENLFSK
ncbi:VOC family protein [Lutimonas sp.]|uniref:VOC family protein n=1 Tax=Lutimonas sp. TaxID=1872403 RepID=UPI003C77555F